MKQELSLKQKKPGVVLVNMLGSESMVANYIHALVKSYGYPMKTVHFREYEPRSKDPTDAELETLSNLVKQLNPQFVFLSVQSLNFWDAMRITEKVRRETEAIIVWGGPHPTVCPEECIEHADMVCLGEGDLAIKELLERYEKGEPLEDIKSMWVRKGKEIIKNMAGPLIPDLDVLPFPDFSDKDKIFLYKNTVSKKNPTPVNKYVYAIMTSRGCPFHCSYCFQSINFDMYKTKFLRQRSVNNVMKELRQVKRKNPHLKSIYFWDNILILNDRWLEQFAKKYRKDIHVPFFCYSHPAMIKDSRMKWLKYMGIKFMYIGIESGSPRIRREVYDRFETQETILKAARVINKYRIKIGYDIITSKFDTRKDFREAFDLFLKIPKPFHLNHNNLTYYPNFKITKEALKKGIIKESDVASQSETIRTQYQTEESIKKNLLVGYYALFGRWYIPNFLIKRLFKMRAEKRWPGLFARLPLLMEKWDESLHAFIILLQLILQGEFRFIFGEVGKRIANITR